MKVRLLLAGMMLATVTQPAAAVVFTSGSGTITNTDMTQTDRLFRNGVASTWANQKSYPGGFGAGTTYYDLVNTTFASNALQTIYYEIVYSSTRTSPVPFAAAYLNTFNPANLAMNYLGDAGSSPIGTPVTYQVIVNAGQQLLLNFQSVGGTPTDYSYSVAAFSDANRGENFESVASAVPEPASWAMMMLGLGAVGFAMRSAKRRSDVKFDARIKRLAAGLEA